MNPRTKKTLYIAFWILILGIAIYSCSDLRNPTEQQDYDPSGGPPFLTPDNHREGYGRKDCTICHITTRLAGHQGITPDQCVGCHGDNGSASDNGLCTTCHGAPPATGAHSRHPIPNSFQGASWIRPSYNSIKANKGSHASMVRTSKGLIERSDPESIISINHLNRSVVDTASCNLCHYGAGADSRLHRNGITNVVLAPPFPGFYSGGACQVEICHGAGKPDWFGGCALGCSDCHSTTGEVFNDPKSGLHGVDLPTMNSDCSNCHEAAPSQHYNQTMDNPDHIKPDGGSYRDDTSGGYNLEGTSGVCYGMHLPCHSPNQEIPWTASREASCGSCHGATPATPPTSGAHAIHAGSTGHSYACNTCHYGFDSGFGASHLDGNINVALNPRFGGSWNGDSCSDVSCHGSGEPNWTSDHDPTCTDCHELNGGKTTDPRSGRHETHLRASGVTCSTCHPAEPSSHYNHSLDNPDNIIPDSGVYNDTTSGGFDSSGSSGTCADMKSPCHSGGDWNPNGSIECGSCHGYTADNPPTTGSHLRHAGISGRGYDCSVCHFGFSSGTGPEHNNGVANVRFDPSSLAGDNNPNYSNGSCSGIYCHGDGNPALSAGSDRTPAWGQPASGACGTCHGASSTTPPSTGSHPEHAGDFQYECLLCHNGVGPRPDKMPNAVLEVAFDRADQPDARYTYGTSPNTGTCYSTTCHGDQRWDDH